MNKENLYYNNCHIMIQGPCAAESAEQVQQSALEAKKRGVRVMRACLWKPRTNPSFEGAGEKGLPWFTEIAQTGLIPATEVLFPEHVDKVMNAVLPYASSEGGVIVWIGSRNQNHMIQQQIGKAIAGEPNIMLMIKNQMWADKDHWKGIVRHVIAGGADPTQIILCHRGFAPKTERFRNPPDLELALKVTQELRDEFGIFIPTLGDPSHIAGYSQQNVINMAKHILDYRMTINEHKIGFDGLIIEVHPNPQQAQTDSAQQLTPLQADQIYEYANK